MTRRSAFFIGVIAATALISYSAPPASAQQVNPQLGFIPVRIIVPERTTAPSAHVQIMRSASDSSYVIVLPAALAKSDAVYAAAAAIRSLLLDPKSEIHAPDHKLLSVSVTGASPARARAIADSLLAKLRVSAPYTDATFGLVRSTIVYVRRPGVWTVARTAASSQASLPVGNTHP